MLLKGELGYNINNKISFSYTLFYSEIIVCAYTVSIIVVCPSSCTVHHVSNVLHMLAVLIVATAR